MKNGLFDRIENILPKIVLAPTFVAAVIFIYGFIGWTAWISCSQSELLPDYSPASGYRISVRVLEKLENSGLPANIISKLEPLVGQDPAKERNFLSAVSEQLGDEDASKYQTVLLKEAYKRDILLQYKKLFLNDRWIVALRNLVVFSVLFIGLCILIGLLLAILLDQRIRAEGFLRTIYLYPMAISFIVTGAVWRWVMNPELGLERLVRQMGFSDFTFRWLVESNTAIYAVVMAAVWQSSGFVLSLFLAGLRGIDDSIIRAAQVDGAGLPRIYWRIIIPSMKPVFMSSVIILSHIAIKSFDLVMALTQGGPGYATDMPATFMYAFSFNRARLAIGASSAIIMFMTVMAIIIPYLYSQQRRTRNAG